MKISVVIVTHNRCKELVHCLGSISAQSEKPDEIIIIDNNSIDDTVLAVKQYAKAIKFPVLYCLEKKRGYPVVYNRGLQESSFSWVAFIDDDCVASPEWLTSIKQTIKKYPDAAAILGNTETYFNNNIFSQLYSFKEKVWKNNGKNREHIVDTEILDNKNIVYNKHFLQLHHIQFDTSTVKNRLGASEDCDLGMQICVANGKAFYQEKMKAYHKDPLSLLQYYKKVINIAKAHAKYERKWDTIRKKNHFSFDIRKGVTYTFLCISKQQNSVIWKIFFLFHLTLTFGVVKITKFYEKHTSSRTL